MNDYNFDNFTFDINFGEVTEKDLDRMKKEEAEYQEELRKEAEAKKQKKWLYIMGMQHSRHIPSPVFII